MNKNIELGVIVGRFQIDDLHDGHCQLIEYALTNCNNVIIFLGISQNKLSSKNPLSYETRKLMIKEKYPNIDILPLHDTQSDTYWSSILDFKIREYSILHEYKTIKLFGGRDSFIKLYTGEFECEQIEEISGDNSTDKRKFLTSNIENNVYFRHGIIYGKFDRYNLTVPTVDIILRKNNSILVCTKKGEPKFRFPGGFVDPTDNSFEEAARREIKEETGLIVDKLNYVSSIKINDWRFKGENDSIITTLFEAIIEKEVVNPIANDDIEWCEFIELIDLHKDLFVEEHIKLYSEYKKYLENKLLNI